MNNDVNLVKKFEKIVKDSSLSTYYNNFDFDFNEISQYINLFNEDIMRILNGNNDYTQKSIYKFFCDNSAFYRKYFVHSSFLKILSSTNENVDEDNQQIIVVVVKFVFSLVMSDVKLQKNDLFGTKYYRGQSVSNWGLVPSIYRQAKNFVDNDIELFDYNRIVKEYKNVGLFDKYEELFGDTGPYFMLSFFQHSSSFSPLIDFTKEESIAISFALSNTSDFSTYRHVDSAYFELSSGNVEIENDKIKLDEFFLNEYRMIYSKKKTFKLSDLFDAAHKLGKCIKSIVDLVSLFKPSYKIIDYPTNDRMKYQKGIFVVFYDCIVRLDNKIFYELNEDFNIDKKPIKVLDKDDKKNSIPRKYDVRLMLNPYEYFNE